MARKTVLVCDNCGKEVAEGKGATLRLTFTDARRGAKQADLCDNCADRHAGHPAARRGAVRSLRRRNPRRPSADALSPHFPRFHASDVQEPSGPGLRWVVVPLTLLAGPANAGKVALLLERYLAALDAGAGPDRAEPGRTSSGSSATCSRARRRAARRARSGRSTTCSRGSRARRRRAPGRERRAARAARPPRRRRAPR